MRSHLLWLRTATENCVQSYIISIRSALYSAGNATNHWQNSIKKLPLDCCVQCTLSLSISAQKHMYMNSWTLYINRSQFLWHNKSVAPKTSYAQGTPPNAVDSLYYPFSTSLSLSLFRSGTQIRCYRVFTLKVLLFCFKIFTAFAVPSAREAIFISHFRTFRIYFQTSVSTTNTRRNESDFKRTKIVS